MKRNAIVLLMLLPALSGAQQCRITSFQSDGTLVWTNSVSNLYCGVEYTEVLGGYWKEAPVPWFDIWVTGLVHSIQLPPLSEFEEESLFLRIVCSTNLLGHYYDPSNGAPRFVSTDYTELDKIAAISRFRSGYGHDHSDVFESCRSMKHYYAPFDSFRTNGAIEVYSPVDGVVRSIQNEQHGTSEGLSNKQIRIRSSMHPELVFVIFHTDLVSSNIVEGSTVNAGMLLGHAHMYYPDLNEYAYNFDIAVWAATLEGERYISYFDVMTHALFTNYIDRGASDRSDFIITKEERDADPLICDDDGIFLYSGMIPNWVYLSASKE